MLLTNERLFDSLNHNRKLLRDIDSSGLSYYYNTDIVQGAIDSILNELRHRGFQV